MSKGKTTTHKILLNVLIIQQMVHTFIVTEVKPEVKLVKPPHEVVTNVITQGNIKGKGIHELKIALQHIDQGLTIGNTYNFVVYHRHREYYVKILLKGKRWFQMSLIFVFHRNLSLKA